MTWSFLSPGLRYRVNAGPEAGIAGEPEVDCAFICAIREANLFWSKVTASVDDAAGMVEVEAPVPKTTIFCDVVALSPKAPTTPRIVSTWVPISLACGVQKKAPAALMLVFVMVEAPGK